MSVNQIYVSLKITDNIARTALHTCKRRLGFDRIRSLHRAEFWEIAFPGLSTQQARQTVERLVEKTPYFVNPNKHRWHIDTFSTNDFNIAISVPAHASASILVCDHIDGKAEATLEAIQRITEGDERPTRLRRGTVWEVTFDGLNQQETIEAAERLTVTKSRTEGLLANLHYQSYQIFYP